jgi:hypothetical protein
LAQAALDAASRWVYEPYQVDGRPVPVRSIITVNFVLD